MSSFLSGWSFRKQATPESLTTDQVNITVHFGSGTDDSTNVFCNSHCKSDFSDIRFTKSDGITLLIYAIDSIINGVSCNAYISASSDIMFIYYGNPNASYIGNLTIKSSNQITHNIININSSVPGALSTVLCPSPFFDSGIISGPIPSNLVEAWVAIQGLTNYSDVTNSSVNGLNADDLFVFYINGIVNFVVRLSGSPATCGFSVTNTGPASINITSALLSSKGQNATFKTQGYDIGTSHSITSGAVYLFSPFVISSWGSEEQSPQPPYISIGSSLASGGLGGLYGSEASIKRAVSKFRRGMFINKISSFGISVLLSKVGNNIISSSNPVVIYNPSPTYSESLSPTESIDISNINNLSPTESLSPTETISITNV